MTTIVEVHDIIDYSLPFVVDRDPSNASTEVNLIFFGGVVVQCVQPVQGIKFMR